MPGLLDNLTGGMSGITSENSEQSRNGDRDTFTENRMNAWTGDNLVDGSFVELFNYQVPAQTGYTWGYGEPVPGKADNQGRIYFDAQGDTPENVEGRVRLNSRNAVGKNREDHGTFHTTELRQTLGDRTTWVLLPERSMPLVGEDSYLYGEFEYDSNASVDSSIDSDNSTMRINATEFTL